MKKYLFQKAGLTKNESLVYSLLLEKGELAPADIALETGVARQNCYAVLKSLEEKGLAKKDGRHNKIHYAPESPEIISHMCSEQIQNALATKEALDAAMGELVSFYNLAKDRPGISVFHGVEGIQSLYEDSIRQKPKEILMFLSEKGKTSYLDAWIVRNYRPKRIKNKTWLRQIINTPENADTERLKSLLWEKKYVNMPKMPRNIDILMYENTVTIINYSKKEPVSFTIDDKLVYLALSSMFETIWSS